MNEDNEKRMGEEMGAQNHKLFDYTKNSRSILRLNGGKLSL